MGVSVAVKSMICKKCGHRTILAIGGVDSFYPDEEPYESGKREDCGFEEITIEGVVSVFI